MRASAAYLQTHSMKRKATKATGGRTQGQRQRRFYARDLPVTRRRNVRIEGYLGIENKFHDAIKAATALPNNAWAGGEFDPATANCLNGIDEGNGESQRLGRQYTIHGIQVRGHIQLDAQEDSITTSSDVMCVICLVQDTQSNGAQLSAENVMDDSLTSGYHAFRNLQYIKRFRIWKTMRVCIKTDNDIYAQNAIMNGTKYVPFEMYQNFASGVKVTCTATGATVAAISDNSFHIVACALSDSNTYDRVKIAYTSRVRFVG